MTRLLGAVVGASLVAACATVDAPSERETESASTTTQGIDYQGIDYQGIDYQGIDYQGIDYQGIDYQGATYGGVSGDATISGTALAVWTPGKNGSWLQRLPDRTCSWNTTRTVVSPCTYVNLAVAPSPLAGATFQVTFEKPDHTTFVGTVRIGSGTSEIGAVKADTQPAMFPITGPDATGTVVACANPAGCRVNTNIWLYRLDLIMPGNAPINFCKGGQTATALAGTWDRTGQRRGGISRDPRFTFACTNGTIAKCTRWGYRPWARAIKTGDTTQTPVSLADYHQACVRAATADYCANGHSFTKNGTLVDLYDYQPFQNGAMGFIPRTLSPTVHTTAFVWESRFDKAGAIELDFLRYQGLVSPESYGGLEDPTVGCPGKFDPGTAPAPNELHQPILRNYPTATAPTVAIDNTLFCAHSELVLGRGLHPSCSACTYSMWNNTDGHCVQGGVWDQSCIDRATQCAAVDRMAAHGECSIGKALTLYDSACTIAVCSAQSGCCGSTGWTAACVSAANSLCTGGRETQGFGFCGTAITGSF